GGSQTKSGDGGKNLVRRFRPGEGLRMPIAHGEVMFDGRLQFAGAPMRPATDLLLRERGEPALHEIDPGGAGRGEVQMKSWPFGHSAMAQRGLVGLVVVEDQMDVEPAGHRRVDRIEKVPELGGAMAAVTLAEHLAGLHVQGCKERGRAVPAVV